MLVASDDLPMPGRPASTIRPDGGRPPIMRSRARRPVGTPEREGVGRAAVVARVDHRGRLGGEAREVLASVKAGDVEVRGQEGLERDRRRGLAGAHQRADVLVDLLMQRLEEVLWLEEVGDAIERLVIDENRAEQRLLDAILVNNE